MGVLASPSEAVAVADPRPKCPNCQASRVILFGHRVLPDESELQRFKCRNCSRIFSESNILKAYSGYIGGQPSMHRKGEAGENLAAQTCIELLCAGDNSLLSYAWILKRKRQNADSTIRLRVRVLQRLKSKGVALGDPETVEGVLATEPLSQAQKFQMKMAYQSYTKAMHIQWDPPKIRYEPKQQFVPTDEEVSALIHAAWKPLATCCQVAVTTGARIGEIVKIQWTDVNTEKNLICINDAEKGSRNRTIGVPSKTIAMVNALSREYEPYVFKPNVENMRKNLCNLKNRLAETQQNPRFRQIHFHTFRHYFATEKLKQTKMLPVVQRLLGHKSILSTERYIHLFDYTGDKYFSAEARTVGEVRQLAEDGWTYFAEVEGVKIFRKPK